jgi:hypothetical protein
LFLIVSFFPLRGLVSYPRASIDIVRAHEYRNRRQICAFRRDVPRVASGIAPASAHSCRLPERAK